MKKFLFLYKGYTTPTPEIGKAWMEWFAAVGDAMVDSGNPMSAGVEVTKEAVTSFELGLDSFTGYSIINAVDMDAAIALAKTNPMITSVVVHDLARM
jgi:hypothetical protein